MLVPHIPTGLLGNDDTELSIINMELPPGSSVKNTDLVTQKLTTLLLKDANVHSVQTDENVNYSTLYVNLKPRGKERKISRIEFENQVRPLFRQIPGVHLSFQQDNVGGGTKQLAIVLKSEDAKELTRVAEDLEKQMHQVAGLVEIASSASLVKPEILIRPDPQRAADQNVSVQAIARTANLSTLGDTDANLAKFDLPNRQIPIRVQLDPKYRNDINTIRNLQVQNKSGNLIPLQTVASITFGSGSSQIDRYNRSRKISVEANLQGISLGDALAAVNNLPAFRNLPSSVKQEKFGDAKIMQELFSNVTTALGAAVLFIYAVLVLLFGDFLHPITIMAALPFSIGGALLGLLLTQKELNLYALIGVVLLMGLVTKNSILLVDYILVNRRSGQSLFKAILDSGVARLRPILMTTIAMIAGMVPIALGIGAGSEVRSPMAIAVIGGLMTSTLLTLVVVPVIFTYVDRLQRRVFGQLLSHIPHPKVSQGNKDK